MKDTKSKILNTAIKLFAEKGYDNTGIEEIAQNVGIKKSGIYYYYKSKKDILNTIFDNFFNAMMELKIASIEDFKKIINNNKLTPDKLKKIIFEEKKTQYDIVYSLIYNNRNVIKILIMESIKCGEDIPIFRLWDMNVNTGLEKGKGLIDKKVLDNIDSILFTGFFAGLMPIIMYAVFSDKYSRRYKISKKKMEKFLNDFMSFYSKEYLNM